MNAHQPAGQAGRRWPAPAAAGPVRASVTLPGSKSMTNRALVLAALADGPGAITRPLHARDTLLMARALTALGARIDTGDTPGTWRVTPGRPAGTARVDVGNAGTVMRFVPPVAALTAATVEFHGDALASQRPVAPILAALRELGAVIDDGGRGAIPFAVRGTGSLPGGAVTLDASASSQFVSGLLLAAPRFDKGVEIRHRGERIPSAPHVAMTVQMLRAAGAEVETASRHNDPSGPHAVDTWRVHPGPVRAGTLAVEPDVVNAAPFLAAALITGGTVTISGWPRRTAQPAGHILDLFTRLGGRCETTDGGLAVTGTGTHHGRGVRQLRRPPAGDGGRGARARRPRHRGGEPGHRRQDLPGVHQPVAGDAGGHALTSRASHARLDEDDVRVRRRRHRPARPCRPPPPRGGPARAPAWR